MLKHEVTWKWMKVKKDS
jgi:hypothetical protein